MTPRKFTLCILVVILSLFTQLSFGALTPFPQSVIKEMATRQMRYHHYLWHQVREGWNRFSTKTQDAFRKIGWEPPRAARSYDSNGGSSAILDNNSGEDFLYMHRQMIATANSIIAKNKEPYGKIKGWTTIPAPGDKDYPVPKAYQIPDDSSSSNAINNKKTDSYYKNSILKYDKMFKDPAQLRKMSLGELGARIDVSIHGWMHMRWSDVSSLGYRDGYKGTIPNIDKKWDNIAYDWLGDSYASHVHPLFWKIHGWVDDRIEDWRVANGLSSIKWKGTWTGGPMSNLNSVMKMSGYMSDEDSEGNIDVLEEAFKILKESGVPEIRLSDPVTLPAERHGKVCKVRKAKL